MAENVGRNPVHEAELPRVGPEAVAILTDYRAGTMARDDAHNELVRLGYLDLQARKLLDYENQLKGRLR